MVQADQIFRIFMLIGAVFLLLTGFGQLLARRVRKQNLIYFLMFVSFSIILFSQANITFDYSELNHYRVRFPSLVMMEAPAIALVGPLLFVIYVKISDSTLKLALRIIVFSIFGALTACMIPFYVHDPYIKVELLKSIFTRKEPTFLELLIMISLATQRC